MERYSTIGKVVAIYIQDKKKGPRQLIEEGFFKKDLGLVGDIHSKGGNRQVSIFTEEGRNNIISSDIKGLCTERFHENITVKNLNLDKIKLGSRIIIGNTIQEVTEIGKNCFSQCNIIKEGKTCPLSREVIFTKIIKEGSIKIGDIVEIERELIFNDEINKYINNIINSIPMGIAISDLDGNIKIANGQLLRMFGYSFTEIREKKVSQLFKGWPTVKNIILSKNNFIDEEVFINAKTNKLRFNLSAYPLFDASGEIVDIIYIFNEFRKERKLANKIMGRQAIYTFDKIIGQNRGFKKLIEFSKKIADSKSTVLITGESGTGKEIFAQSIHNYGNRKDEPFVAINSGAIPKSLIESELFGYVEGAFTGAKKGGQPGKFEIADGGTIFLDEIGEMPYDMQTRLLRVIEEGVVSRIGGVDQKVVDVRIIAASNRDLKEEVKKGNFRRDLFYRLNVLPIEIPPLRERKEDIPILIDYFMKKVSKRLNKKEVPIRKEQMEKLINYEWPGNVRELENFIELIINMESVPIKLTNDNFKLDIKEFDDIDGETLSLEQVEKKHIIKVLKKYSGNITHSAEVLGIGRNTLYRKIEKYKIDCSEIEQSSKMEQK
jgi:transcriptional regulator with PAS, ATPase and Fis domain